MQKNIRIKFTFSMAISLLLAVVFLPSAWAACVATCAVTEAAKMDFATVEKPSSGSVTYTIAADTGATSGTAVVLYGTAARGAYTATRTGVTTGCTGTTFTVNNANTGDAGITLGTFKVSYNGGGQRASPSTLAGTYPATTGTVFRIGGTATYTSSANTGAITPSLDVTCTIN
jgi:hypothetical protein